MLLIVFAVNARGVHIGTQAALPYMPDGGRIILIGSAGGETAPFPGLSTYSATKSALNGFARGWARDLAPRNILVNVIQPGPIETDMSPKGDAAELFKKVVPLGRFGEVEEMSGVAAFLAGPDATYITGSIINVDDGMLI
jgi:3-oxoacyl-[acyl-carrier protein] reductase